MKQTPFEIISDIHAGVEQTEPKDDGQGNTSAAWQLWYLRQDLTEYARAAIRIRTGG